MLHIYIYYDLCWKTISVVWMWNILEGLESYKTFSCLIVSYVTNTEYRTIIYPHLLLTIQVWQWVVLWQSMVSSSRWPLSSTARLSSILWLDLWIRVRSLATSRTQVDSSEEWMAFSSSWVSTGGRQSELCTVGQHWDANTEGGDRRSAKRTRSQPAVRPQMSAAHAAASSWSEGRHWRLLRLVAGLVLPPLAARGSTASDCAWHGRRSLELQGRESLACRPSLAPSLCTEFTSPGPLCTGAVGQGGARGGAWPGCRGGTRMARLRRAGSRRLVSARGQWPSLQPVTGHCMAPGRRLGRAGQRRGHWAQLGPGAGHRQHRHPHQQRTPGQQPRAAHRTTREPATTECRYLTFILIWCQCTPCPSIPGLIDPKPSSRLDQFSVQIL